MPAFVLRGYPMIYREGLYPTKRQIKLYAGLASGLQPSLDVYSGTCGQRGSTTLEQKAADLQGVTFCICQQNRSILGLSRRNLPMAHLLLCIGMSTMVDSECL